MRKRTIIILIVLLVIYIAPFMERWSEMQASPIYNSSDRSVEVHADRSWDSAYEKFHVNFYYFTIKEGEIFALEIRLENSSISADDFAISIHNRAVGEDYTTWKALRGGSNLGENANYVSSEHQDDTTELQIVPDKRYKVVVAVFTTTNQIGVYAYTLTSNVYPDAYPGNMGTILPVIIALVVIYELISTSRRRKKEEVYYE